MPSDTMAVEAFRKNMIGVFDNVLRGRPVVLTRRGRPTVAIIDAEDIEQYRQFKRIAEAEKHFAEGNFVPLDQLDKELAALNAHPANP